MFFCHFCYQPIYMNKKMDSLEGIIFKIKLLFIMGGRFSYCLPVVPQYFIIVIIVIIQIFILKNKLAESGLPCPWTISQPIQSHFFIHSFIQRGFKESSLLNRLLLVTKNRSIAADSHGSQGDSRKD